ncbi:hypothetical protein PBRA_005515 [Plasmodiophora brassicae]|uniref:Uncharacterized protein n=1 Tax=Plasmodiophora brassicae TaxID=37360 RepID=A0A0G4INU4_PLABS|nr:hypothetical protein PBRA_005515 [Plasmodiophora brassicae]
MPESFITRHVILDHCARDQLASVCAATSNASFTGSNGREVNGSVPERFLPAEAQGTECAVGFKQADDVPVASSIGDAAEPERGSHQARCATREHHGDRTRLQALNRQRLGHDGVGHLRRRLHRIPLIDPAGGSAWERVWKPGVTTYMKNWNPVWLYSRASR